MIPLKIELLQKDLIGLTFAYDPRKVELLRILNRRKWNAARKRWEVHLAHLPEVRRIFGLEDADLPAEVLEAYRRDWTDRRVRVTLGRLHGRLSGVNLPSVELDEATSFAVPGHRFSPQFKAGRWDGRKHLLSRETMRFPAGLWPRIRDVLERNGVDFELRREPEKKSGPPPPAPEFAPPRSELRDYQSEALRGALAARTGIIQIATGGGKTLLAAHLIREIGCGAYFFVHTRDLLHQTAAVLGRELGVEIGCLGDGRADLRPVTVATIQTAARALGISVPLGPRAEEGEESAPKEKPVRLGNRKNEVLAAIASAPAVLFDECHHVPAETFYKVAFKAARAEWRFGLSATPWRDDGHDLLLEAALGPKICEIRASDLIARGYLVAPEIEMARAPGGERIGPRVPYPDVYRRAIVENRSRNRMIAARAAEWAAEGLSVLILVGHVAHGRLLEELVPDAVFAYGALDSETRREHVAGLERKLHKIMIATTLADEGLDIPGLDAIILAGGGKSETRAYQRIGRALRLSPGKKTARVLDFMDTAPWLAEHSLARLRLYQEEPAFKVRTEGFA